ncbi:IS30 family transposase [Bacillus sp. SN10]|uniref:IS30 family transposase n=1 Tax=Bacillus sp. SN10 TaxID=2056493 RepID=UPI001E4A3ABE|nr:IS30 family transposase [Bacillus sp. SN10]
MERKNRYYQAIFIPDRTARSMEFAIKQIAFMYPNAALQTATVDGGKESSCYQRVEKELKIVVFFVYPYSSWQRGSNENANGLLREFYPQKNRFEPCFTRTIKPITTSYYSKTKRMFRTENCPRSVSGGTVALRLTNCQIK